jgi:uncharacterized protein (DUF58 family)
MKLRPGANLVRGVVALALLTPLVFVSWWVVLPLAAALGVLSGLAARERAGLKATFGNVVVRRTMPVVIGRDNWFDVQLAVWNAGERPLDIQLRDEHPEAAVPRLVVYAEQIPAGGTSRFATRCRIPKRGGHVFGPAWLRVEGPRRLLEGHGAIDSVASIKVLPETFASREELQKDLGAELRLLDQQRRARQSGSGTEFESLYPFRRGDDPRRIDWRATARQQTLVVRRFQVERHRDVMIILDSGRLMGTDCGRGTKLDCAVDASLNLARVALQSGDRCGVATYDRSVRGFLPPIAGVSALRAIVECVYGLETQWHESDFTPMLAELRARQGKRTFLIVISDLSDAETSQRLCASLQQLQRQHLVLFAALKTPLLSHVVREPIETLRDGARKAVAFRLLRDRARALHALRHGGVHILDVEPQQLTLPLVNQFVELRQRNLL